MKIKQNIIRVLAIYSFVVFTACTGNDPLSIQQDDRHLNALKRVEEGFPAIYYFKPEKGSPGTEVTLIGKFEGVKSVFFGPIKTKSFSISDDNRKLTVIAPPDALSGPITVKNEVGDAESVRSFESLCDPIVKPENSLVIRDISVVEDPVRAIYSASNPDAAIWSFPFLINQLRPLDKTIDEFLMEWFNEWKNVTTINGFSVTPRLTIDNIISNWPRHEDGTFDLEKAPFRLLAITSRMDVRTETDAGEGRFIFEVISPDGSFQQFTVIFEYKLPLTEFDTIEDWARRWNSLSSRALPGEGFNTRLEALTKRFSTRRFNGIFTNGNAIAQIRTNEQALGDPWEMREFKLDPNSGLLKQTTTAQTPDDKFNKSSQLDQFMLDNTNAILDGSYQVPNDMLAGASLMVETTKWESKNNTVPENVRHEFSLGTCNGCHSGETGIIFTHILPRQAGVASEISGFLRTDLDRRVADLKNLVVENFCSTQTLKLKKPQEPKYRRVH